MKHNKLELVGLHLRCSNFQFTTRASLLIPTCVSRFARPDISTATLNMITGISSTLTAVFLYLLNSPKVLWGPTATYFLNCGSIYYCSVISSEFSGQPECSVQSDYARLTQCAIQYVYTPSEGRSIGSIIGSRIRNRLLTEQLDRKDSKKLVGGGRTAN